MQIVALRAANNAEIPVPAATIERAIKYVRSCSAPAGGFGYQGPAQGPQTSAAGILSLQLLGQYNDPTIPKALEYVATIPIQWGAGGAQYFYYFHYYAIQANYQAGGKHWNDWHPRIRELLVEKQNLKDPKADDYGTITGTTDKPATVTAITAVDRATDKKFSGKLDAKTGRFTISGLPLSAAYDLQIDFTGARLEGVNLQVPRSDYEEEQPL